MTLEELVIIAMDADLKKEEFIEKEMSGDAAKGSRQRIAPGLYGVVRNVHIRVKSEDPRIVDVSLSVRRVIHFGKMCANGLIVHPGGREDESVDSAVE